MDSDWTNAVGVSEPFLQFQENVTRLAACERPVLVVGERGSGKELAARRLHYLSPRWDRPLVTVLCPALSPGLLESELFGHEAGAFTGAKGLKPGLFERADGGTLFLDEVADMPVPLQDRLLRVIEYGSFERVGGVAPVHVDVRVVAATNRDLPRLAAEGRFRADLLDRLAFDVVHVPPLRVRGGDVLLLARHFAARMGVELGLRAASPAGPELGGTALRQLERHSWPGNVRELKNVVERSVARRRSLHLDELDMDPFAPPFSCAPRAEASELASPHLSQAPEASHGACGGPEPAPSHTDKGADLLRLGGSLMPGFRLPAAVAALERAALRKALEQARFRQSEAASLLGLTYHQFRTLYRKYRGEL